MGLVALHAGAQTSMAFSVETERLQLREFMPEDAGFALRQLNEPSFIENIADRGVRDLEQARAYLVSGPIASYASNGFGLWAVLEKPSGRIIGMCGLIKRPHLEHADLGYAFLPEYFGKGFAFEACTATITAASCHFSLQHLLAIVNPDNAPSRRLLEKLGFRLQETRVVHADEPVLCIYHRATGEAVPEWAHNPGRNG
jgi:RimJ/RimL family protein N-acetyltransferase